MYVRACMYVHVCTSMYVCMKECEYVCLSVCINICVGMRVHVRMYVRTSILACVCTYSTYVRNSIASSCTPLLESGGGGRLRPFPDPSLSQYDCIIIINKNEW